MQEVLRNKEPAETAAPVHRRKQLDTGIPATLWTNPKVLYSFNKSSKLAKCNLPLLLSFLLQMGTSIHCLFNNDPGNSAFVTLFNAQSTLTCRQS